MQELEFVDGRSGTAPRFTASEVDAGGYGAASEYMQTRPGRCGLRHEEAEDGSCRRWANAGEGRTLAGQLIAAQEEERRRISLELHDAVSQRIAVTCIALQGLRCHLVGNSAAGNQVDVVLGVMTELAEGVRRLSHAMHPPILRFAGLAAALRGHCHELSTLARLEVELAMDDLPGLPQDAVLCLFRVAQEALGNVVVHAGVHRACLSVSRCSGLVELEVSDAGVGFDLARAAPGLGLAGMGERVRLLGGSFSVESRPGTGTVVRARLPFEDEAPAPAEGAYA